MDAKRIAIGTVVGGITLFVVGYLVFDMAMVGFYEANGGGYALMENEGNNNTASGYAALMWKSTGDLNTGIGAYAGDGISTGSNNTIIGAATNPSTGSATNQIVIGATATGLGDNYAVIATQQTVLADQQHQIDRLLTRLTALERQLTE